AVERVVTVAAHAAHQHVAGHDAAGAVGQRAQQIELIRRQRAFVAVQTHDARAAVDLEAAEAQGARVVGCGGAGGRAGRAATGGGRGAARAAGAAEAAEAGARAAARAAARAPKN